MNEQAGARTNTWMNEQSCRWTDGYSGAWTNTQANRHRHTRMIGKNNANIFVGRKIVHMNAQEPLSCTIFHTKQNKKQNKAASSTTQTCKLSAYTHYMESLRQADQWWVQSYIIHRTNKGFKEKGKPQKLLIRALGYDEIIIINLLQITMHT